MPSELETLKLEHEKLLLAYGRLKWAMDGAAADLEVALDLSPLRARIVAMLMTGKAYNSGQLLRGAWGEDANPRTLFATLSYMKQSLPWFRFKNLKEGKNRGSLYQLDPSAIEYVKRRIDECM